MLVVEQEMPMEYVTIRVDGVDVECPSDAAPAVLKALKQRDDALDVIQAQIDAAEQKTAALKVRLAEAEANYAERVDALVTARLALTDQARKVLPWKSFDGLSTRQIQEAVLYKLDADLELADKSDEYVQARFDGAMQSVAARSRPRFN
jgi:hypothetical protein